MIEWRNGLFSTISLSIFSDSTTGGASYEISNVFERIYFRDFEKLENPNLQLSRVTLL